MIPTDRLFPLVLAHVITAITLDEPSRDIGYTPAMPTGAVHKWCRHITSRPYFVQIRCLAI